MKTIFIFLFLLSSSLWAKTGFYSASFDPPSDCEIEFIRSSLQKNELDRLIIMVERTHSDGYLASGFERARLIEELVADCKDKIQILVEPWSGKETYLAKTKDELFTLENQQKGKTFNQ